MKKFIAIGLALAPSLAFAADINSILGVIRNILNTLVPLLIGIAVVVFLWGVIKYITAGGDEEKRKEARNMMMYGIIGLFVMVAVWGLVAVLGNTLGVQPGGTAPGVPTLP